MNSLVKGDDLDLKPVREPAYPKPWSDSMIISMSWLLALLIMASPSAQARWQTMKESNSVVEKLHMEFDVKKDGTSTQVVEYITKVQSEDAKVHASVFTIEYNSVTDKVDVLEAFTKNGKQVVRVESSAMEDRDKGDSRDYDAMKVRSIVYPQVEVGSELHVKYRLSTAKALMKDRWSTQINFMPSVYVRDLKILIRSERPLFYEVKDPRDLIAVTPSGTSTLEVRNIKPLPGWIHAEKDPFFHPAGFSEVWVSTEKDWSPFLQDLEGDYDRILSAGLPKKLKPWVEQALKKKSLEDKITFVLEKMSQSFRYFGDWRRHDGGLVPRPLSEIESSRYGDCKDLATLLTAMLRSLKIDARVALIRRGENPWGAEPDYKLPASNRFNHAIVAVHGGDKTYWLDPTNPVTSLNAYPDISGRPAWVMGPRNGVDGQFERLPAAEPKDFQHVHQYSYRFKSDDEVKVEVDARLKALAPYRIANELLMSSRSEVLSSTLEYFSEGQEVHGFDYKKEPKTGRSLKDMEIELDYTAGKVAYNAGRALFWVIPDGFLEGAFYETDERESDLRLGETPFDFRGVRRLVNTKLAQDPPEPCHVDSKWMTLDRRVRTDGKDVLIEQAVDLKQPYVTHAEYRTPEFRKLQSDAKRCFHRAGVLIEPVKRG